MNLGMQYNLRNGVFHANVTEFVVLRHLEFPLLVFLPATVSSGLEQCILDELTGTAKKECGSLIAFIHPLNNPLVATLTCRSVDTEQQQMLTLVQGLMAMVVTEGPRGCM